MQADASHWGKHDDYLTGDKFSRNECKDSSVVPLTLGNECKIDPTSCAEDDSDVCHLPSGVGGISVMKVRE
jgi:hypothetical protein